MRAEQRGPAADQAVRRLRYRLLLAASGLFLVAGCVGMGGDSSFATDPLLGGTPVPRRPPGATPTGGTPAKQAGVPPMPAPHSSTSTAALAGGVFQPLDARPELRAGAPAGAWRAPGATLQGPESAGEPPARADTGPAAGFTLASGTRSSLSYEQAQATLAARGVTWQRLETGTEPGEWKFSCSVPNRQNPSIRRFYEARAHEAVSAMRAVIEQMERGQ